MARLGLAAVAAQALLVAVGANEVPPVVEFIGRAPKLRIYPGGNTGNDTWMMLSFGKIQELDPRGRKVQGRVIPNLAAEERGIVWSQENRSIGGAPALVTSMELPLSYGGRFRERCRRGGGKRGRSLAEADDDRFSAEAEDGRLLEEAGSSDSETLGSVTIDIFVFQSDAVVDYGDFQIEVLRGQIKFNVEAVGWPFCGLDHQLEVNMGVKVKGDKPPKRVREEPEEEVADDDETTSTTSGNLGNVPPSTTQALNTNLNLDINMQRRKRSKEGKGGKDGGQKEKKPRRKPRRKPKRKAMRQSAGKRDIDFNFPEAVLADNASAACEVLVQARGKTTNIAFRFPYFEDTLLYDPTTGFVDPDGSQEPTMTKTVVSGSFKLSTEDPAAFCADAQVIAGLKKAVARAAKQEASAVDLACAPSAGRRRLAASQGVEIKYDITIPADAPEAAGAEAAVAALSELSTEQLSAMVNEELASAGAAVSVQVTELAAPAEETVFYTTAAPTIAGSTTTAASTTEPLSSGVQKAAASAMVAFGLVVVGATPHS